MPKQHTRKIAASDRREAGQHVARPRTERRVASAAEYAADSLALVVLHEHDEHEEDRR